MDRLTKYRKLLERLFNAYEHLYSSRPRVGVESFVIFDEERGHYILMSLGWHEGRRVRQMVLYVRLRNEKIWVEEDWTEEGIATELLKAGVPKDDILLAFHPPETWSLSEFAVA